MKFKLGSVETIDRTKEADIIINKLVPFSKRSIKDIVVGAACIGFGIYRFSVAAFMDGSMASLEAEDEALYSIGASTKPSRGFDMQQEYSVRK